MVQFWYQEGTKLTPYLPARTVTKMFEKLHPGKRYYLTNLYAHRVKPSEVLAWKDDLWMFPYYTNRNFVPYDAREGSVAALGYQ